MSVSLQAGRAELDPAAAVLRFFDRDDECYYEFKLSAAIEYLDRQASQSPAELIEAKDGHFVFASRDDFTEKEIHVQFLDGAVDYWLVGRPIEADVEIACVHYGQDGPGHEHASPHRLEEFFIVCPDRYGSGIPASAKICFKLGVPSFRFDKDNNFPHEGGRTIIPPYFAALRTGDDWLGVGTMEIPASEYGLNMTFADGLAVTDFYYGGNLKLTGEYAFPRITFFTKGDKVAAAKTYVDRLYADGLAVRNDQWSPDWAGPIYCFFSDQMYQYQTDRSTQQLEGEMTMTNNYCNDAFLEACLGFLEVHAIHYEIIIIDYGWFITNGEWLPNVERFKNFRATIARLQAKGKKVLVWYSPYFIAAQSSHYREHPEIAVMKRDGTPMSVIRLGTEVNYQSDYTHPTMRELCRADMEFMLRPDGLNADGIKIDCTHQPPTIDNVFHDPDWGTGERFHYNASKYMYDQAKQIKPDCCINATAGNPLFNRTYDLHRIHDAMEYNLDAYEERAWAAWLCGVGVSDLDDWPSYDLYTVRANIRKIAYGVPSLYAAHKRGGARKLKASWGYSITPRQDELELLASIFDLYAKTPVDLTQEIHIDPFAKVFWRKFSDNTAGPLAGFYAATTLCGNQAAAVYDTESAWVASIADAALAVPLPPGATNVALEQIDRNDAAEPIADFELLDGEMLFEARRCCGPLKYYRITYSLPA